MESTKTHYSLDFDNTILINHKTKIEKYKNIYPIEIYLTALVACKSLYDTDKGRELLKTTFGETFDIDIFNENSKSDAEIEEQNQQIVNLIENIDSKNRDVFINGTMTIYKHLNSIKKDGHHYLYSLTDYDVTDNEKIKTRYEKIAKFVKYFYSEEYFELVPSLVKLLFNKPTSYICTDNSGVVVRETLRLYKEKIAEIIQCSVEDIEKKIDEIEIIDLFNSSESMEVKIGKPEKIWKNKNGFVIHFDDSKNLISFLNKNHLQKDRNLVATVEITPNSEEEFARLRDANNDETLKSEILMKDKFANCSL